LIVSERLTSGPPARHQVKKLPVMAVTRSSPRAGDALAESYADLLNRVRSADALNIDKTGWRLKGA
jgi:hypothetical protein